MDELSEMAPVDSKPDGCTCVWDTERLVTIDGCTHHAPRITRVSDLLTPEEHASLNADLAEMARIRRRAMNAAADLPMA